MTNTTPKNDWVLYDEWRMFTVAGQHCERKILELIEKDGAEKLIKHETALTENLYQRLPSGDYGRGYVRRAIRYLCGQGDSR